MRSSLYANNSARHTKVEPGSTNAKELEEQTYRENEQLLDALGANVTQMKSMASGLHREAEQHNELLKTLQNAVQNATSGVQSSIRNLKGVFERNDWRYKLGVIVIVFVVLYIIYCLLRG